MIMTFKYTEITDEYEDEQYGNDFEYEVDDSKIKDKICEFIAEDYFEYEIIDMGITSTLWHIIIKGIKSFLNDCDEAIWEELEERYYDNLKDSFKSEAFESLKD
jgi:hypothetical protein